MKGINFIASISLWLILVLPVFSSKAQNTGDFLNEYYPVGLQGFAAKIAKGEVFKQDPSINYSIEPYITGQFGIAVNIYQTKHWNFKTGFLFKYMVIRKKLLFTQEQTGLEFDDAHDITFGTDDNIKSIPLHAEYLYKLNNKLYLSLLSGFSIGWWKNYGGGGGHGVGNGIDPPTMIVMEYHSKENKPIYTSTELGVGFYVPTKHLMIHTIFLYSKSFNSVLEGSYETSGYHTEPESSTGTFTQSGDYWAIGLTFYIKKKGQNK